MSGADDSPGALTRRHALLGAALLATSAVAALRAPRQRVVALEQGKAGDVLPLAIGPWRKVEDEGFVLPPPDEGKAAATYEEIVTRTYVDGATTPVMLVVAYSRAQSDLLMVHRPESCYPGSGFTITADSAVTIPLGPGLPVSGRFLSTRRETRIEQVLYWTRLGNEFPATWAEERRFLALQNLRGLKPDGVLVRLSCLDEDPAAARQRLEQFAALLYRSAPHDGRALLAGPANA